MSRPLRNPFHSPFTMERVRSPDEFFQYFSPGVLERVCSKLAEPLSHFVVGPNGCGKTTCLRFMQYRNQSHIADSTNLREEFAALLGQLPREFVGIYYTIRMGPIGRFAGKGIDSRLWASMYGNYLNYILVEELVRFLGWCGEHAHATWAEAHGVRVSALAKLLRSGLEDVVSDAARRCGVTALTEDLRRLPSATSTALERVEKALVGRLNEYHRLLSASRGGAADLPSESVEPGVLLHEVVSLLRDRGVLGRTTVLFVMLDEYDALAWCQDNEFLRRVINACVSSCSRIPESGILYKIGSRRWALQDMMILGSDARIERDRDYAIIDLAQGMPLTDYRPFAEDVTARLLRAAEDFEGKNLRELLATRPEGRGGATPKYYGYDSVMSASYPIIFYHLRLCKNLVDNALPLLQQGHWQIPVQSQDDAIRLLADRLFEEIATERSRRGSELQQLLSRLGQVFQGTPPPTASILIARGVYDENKAARDLLEEAVDHALLDCRETDASDKLPAAVSRGLVFSLCQTLRPRFALPLQTSGRPVHITEVELRALMGTQKDWAESLERLLERLRRLSDEGGQGQLFGGTS